MTRPDVLSRREATRGLLGALLCARGVLAFDPEDIPLTGPDADTLAPFDDLLRGFLDEHGCPGASVSVSRAGRVVYARGFGHATRGGAEPVNPDALFRIASVTKPLTAVAVLQLVRAGRLDLNDNPFEVLGRGDALGAADADPRLRAVTIRMLLHHTGGWDRGESFDPMFIYRRIADTMKVSSPPDHDAIIGFMLRQPLQFDPGSRHAYSNFGYCVLGRVIERITGETYEASVRRSVFAPLGVEDPRIGRSLPDQRADGEVVYHDHRDRTGRTPRAPGRTVPRPYCIDHEVMDSHGGWIASAPSLVRFVAAFDDLYACPLLDAEGCRLMVAPPPGVAGHDDDGSVRTVYYGMGWQVRRVNATGTRLNLWHTGLINGTSSLLVRRWDGLDWCVLFNSGYSRANGKVLAALIDGPMHGAAAKVKTWPTE